MRPARRAPQQLSLGGARAGGHSLANGESTMNRDLEARMDAYLDRHEATIVAELAQLGAHPGRPPLTCLSHTPSDGRPPEPLEEWITPPFAPSLREGKLFARGASDNKGHIVSRLAAPDALPEASPALPCRVQFVIEGEEEISSPNLPAFVEDNASRLAADGCIWEFGGGGEEGG